MLTAVLLAAGAGAQTAAARFAATFQQASDKIAKITGSATERNRVAMEALQLLDQAEAQLAEVAIDPQRPKRPEQLRFFVGVRRAEVYVHVGTDLARGRAAEFGRKARARAFRSGVYSTYYRAVLLITLSRAMPEHEFLTMLDDELGDGAYLRGSESEADAVKMQARQSSYAGHLRLLRGWIDLTRRPARAVRALQKLGLELKQDGEAGRDLRDEVFSRLAWHFMELRDFERAKLYLDEVTRDDSRYPRAMIDYKQGEFEFCAEEAEKLYKTEKRPEYALLLANARERLAQRARADDDPAKAKRLLELALRHFGEAMRGAQQRRDAQMSAAALNGRGDCYLGLDQLDPAQKSYEAVLRLLKDKTSFTEQAERAETWKDLGRLAERRNEPERALAHFTSALSEIERIRKRIPLDALGIAWLEPSQLEAVDGVLRLAVSGAVAPLQALATVDRMKARGLLDWMRSPPSAQELAKYREALTELAKARSAAAIRGSRLTLDTFRGREARQQAVALDEAAVRDLLRGAEDTAFVSFWIGTSLARPRAYAIAARNDVVEVFDLGDVAEAVRRYDAAIAAVRAPEGDAWPALDAAAEFFFPPALCRHLPQGGRVVVCTDSEMGDLPVEAMRVDGTPLGIRHVVYRTPSLSVMHELGSRSRSSDRVLVFDSAEPTEEDRALHELSELTFSGEEGDLVTRAHGECVRMSKGLATYDQLRRALTEGEFGLLHVSCHAISHRRIPSASLLMLSGEPLDMGTLATLKMDGMLVVFSSCTSRGAAKAGGEGVKGLLWGPLAAKARAVVASHWEMNQQATKDLMGQFHHHLAAGCEVGEAMRRAREALSKADNYAHPTYWAGFGVFAAPSKSVDPSGIRRASKTSGGGPAPPRSTGTSGASWMYGLLALGLLLLGFVAWKLRRS